MSRNTRELPIMKRVRECEEAVKNIKEVNLKLDRLIAIQRLLSAKQKLRK